MAVFCRKFQQATFLCSRLFHAVPKEPILILRKTQLLGVHGNFQTNNFVKSLIARPCSTYDPYQSIEEPPSPFRPRGKDRIGYKVKIYTGGPLPRPEGYEDKKLKGPTIDFRKRDQWTERKALFGQNDYIDILGDGTVHPAELMTGPVWLRRFKGKEIQRYMRRLRFTGRYLKDNEPEKYHTLQKRRWYLYKKMNKRRRKPYWAGTNPGGRNRIFNIKRIE